MVGIRWFGTSLIFAYMSMMGRVVNKRANARQLLVHANVFSGANKIGKIAPWKRPMEIQCCVLRGES